MKKSIKVCGIALTALMACAVIGCNQPSGGDPGKGVIRFLSFVHADCGTNSRNGN